jgi:MFS family permease
MSLETQTPRHPSESEIAAAAPHRRSLWRQRDFMKLWTGQSISQFGDEITLLAIPLLAINTLGAGPLEMGIFGVVRFLPWIFFTLPAGVWVDRMRRRPILIGADLARAALLGSIPLAFVGDWLTLIQVYVVAFAAGTLEVFFDVAYQSYLPSLVERDELVEGNSKLELSRAGSSVVGPTVAGFLIEAIRAPFAIAFDALSYLGAALFIGLIRRTEPEPAKHDPADGKRPTMWQEARAGIGYVFANPYLRSIAACTGTANLFGNVSGAVLILYIAREDGLNLSAGTIGLIFALGNVGVILGALTGGRVAKAIGVGPTIIASAVLAGAAAFAVPLAPREDPFWVLVIGGVFLGYGVVAYNVNQVGLRQAITPDRMLGRMNATMRLIVWGTIPVGALIGGVLGSVLSNAFGTAEGLQIVLWLAAIGGSLAFLPVLFSPVRTLREIPAQAE